MAVGSKLSGVAYGIATIGTNGENMPPAGASEPGAIRRLERAAVRFAFEPSAPSLLSLKRRRCERFLHAHCSADTVRNTALKHSRPQM